MTIKVGDRVCVNGYDYNGDYYDNEKGKVIGISPANPTKIDVELSDKEIRVTPIRVHRKQCRKLVEVWKCEICGGSTKVLYAPLGVVRCEMCNGKGKVKDAT